MGSQAYKEAQVGFPLFSKANIGDKIRDQIWMTSKNRIILAIPMPQCIRDIPIRPLVTMKEQAKAA